MFLRSKIFICGLKYTHYQTKSITVTKVICDLLIVFNLITCNTFGYLWKKRCRTYHFSTANSTLFSKLKTFEWLTNGLFLIWTISDCFEKNLSPLYNDDEKVDNERFYREVKCLMLCCFVVVYVCAEIYMNIARIHSCAHSWMDK